MIVLLLLIGMGLGVACLALGKVGIEKVKIKLEEKKDAALVEIAKKEDELRIKILKVLHEVLPSVVDAPVEVPGIPPVVEVPVEEIKKDEPVV